MGSTLLLLTALRLEKLGDMLEGYEHSEHDNELNWEEVKDFLNNQPSVTTVFSRFTVSVVRGIGSKIISKIPIIKQNDAAWGLLMRLDQVVIKLLCQKPNVLGPGAVLFRLANK